MNENKKIVVVRFTNNSIVDYLQKEFQIPSEDRNGDNLVFRKNVDQDFGRDMLVLKRDDDLFYVPMHNVFAIMVFPDDG